MESCILIGVPQKRWNVTNEELEDLALHYNVSEIARITGFANPTVDRFLAKAGLKAKIYQSKFAHLTEQFEQLACKNHGLTQFRRTMKHGKLDSYKCLECELETGRRKRNKARLAWINQGGGKCLDCENDDTRILQFHHRDPAEKEFTIGSYAGIKSPAKIAAEIEKCDLLCANCHVIRHFEDPNLRLTTSNG